MSHRKCNSLLFALAFSTCLTTDVWSSYFSFSDDEQAPEPQQPFTWDSSNNPEAPPRKKSSAPAERNNGPAGVTNVPQRKNPQPTASNWFNSDDDEEEPTVIEHINSSNNSAKKRQRDAGQNEEELDNGEPTDPTLNWDNLPEAPANTGKKIRKARRWYKEGAYAELDKNTRGADELFSPEALNHDQPDFVDYDDVLDVEDIDEILASAKGMKLDPEARQLVRHLALRKKQELDDIRDNLDMQADEEEDLADPENNEGRAFLRHLQEQHEAEKSIRNGHSIQDVLGRVQHKSGKIGEWLQKIEHLKSLPEVYTYAHNLAKDLVDLEVGSEAGAIKKSQLEVIIAFPWNKTSGAAPSIREAKRILEQHHYGLEKIKKRIIQSLAVESRKPDAGGSILCFVAPPGVGKTTICQAIAEAKGRKFQRLALGGVNDAATIKGWAPGYVGGSQGEIIKAITRAGVNDPVLCLDELDKLGENGTNGSPGYALLEVLDPGQNYAFKDQYVSGVTFDLSKVFFIATANDATKIHPTVRDRLEIIVLDNYTHMEKLAIAEQYLVPKKMLENNMRKGEVVIKQETLENIITQYTREAGVRELERKISQICRAVVTQNELSGRPRVTTVVEPHMLQPILGRSDRIPHKVAEKDTIGYISILANGGGGGSLSGLEVAATKGAGKAQGTGNLGESVLESIEVAWTVVKMLTGSYNLKDEHFTDKDVHIHFLQTETEKNGSSAGAAIATAMVSALGEIPIRKDICMSGELTLLGNVISVGALKNKLIAAHEAGMKIALVPKDNVDSLEDVPQEVKDQMRIIPVSHISEVLKYALLKRK